MPRRILLIIVLTLLYLYNEAGITDSLEQVLPSLSDKERVDVLTRLTRLNYRENPEKAFRYGNEAFELAKKLGYEKGQADALLQISTTYYYQSNYINAVDYLKQSLAIRERLNDTSMILDAMNKISVNLRMMGRIEEALNYSFRILNEYEKMGDVQSTGDIMNNIGGIYKDLNDYDRALAYYNRALEIFTESGNQSRIATISNNVGIIYRHKGEYEKAMEYYQISLEYDLLLGKRREVAQSYNNIGNLLLLSGKPYEALETINKAYAIAKDIGNLDTQTVSLAFKGDINMKLQNYDAAIRAYNEALSITYSTGNIQRRDDALIGLASASLQAGKYRQSSEYFQQLIIIRDSVYKAKINAIVAETEAKYEFEKKAREIENLKQENRIQELKLNENRIITYGLAGLSVLILIIALLLIQRNWLHTRHHRTELEQKLFRTQMNPHFIFNALNAIQSFIYKNDAGEAGKYLSNFARLIRLVLTNSREDLITLDNEIKTLEYYLQLQRLRFNNKFDYTIEIDPAIHTELIMIPPMLAQPFIENSIEHGIQHLSTKGHIRVAYNLNNDSIVFEVEDNGVGINQSMANNSKDLNKHESLAMTITEERLKLLNKTKQQKIQLHIREVNSESDHSKGTLITFSIPFQTLKDKQSNHRNN